MKLKDSFICIECEEIFDRGIAGHCPSCTSGIIMPLAKWIQPAGISEEAFQKVLKMHDHCRNGSCEGK